ncbi:MAG TPA: hypothetical protein PK110_07415 [Niabella sp.]|jgi:thiamine transporter ThiT|nr:hypothetical protein [Chitinophagaceae bacterium]HRO84634.1 hypothetical protein [Niabella sp.]HUN03156.1 hypothetical protein [Niabella sp.]
MNASIQLRNLAISDYRTYLFAGLFVIGNILLPQLAHLMPNGGLIFLPIYFFTLIAAYKYGLMAGLLTAVLSPVLNYAFFGMPPAAFLPAILVKSAFLAIAAFAAAKYFKNISILALVIVVVAYQLLGSAVEWVIVKDINLAVQDLKLGLPGMFLQIFGGYIVLKALAKY